MWEDGAGSQAAHEKRGRRIAVNIAKLHTSELPAISLFFPSSGTVYSSDLVGPTTVAPGTSGAWNVHEWELK